MPYRRINFYQDGYYHVYNRGNRKKDIFIDNGDYFYFLKVLKEYRVKHHIRVVAYCLMPNHFHFLLQQKSDTSVSEFMRYLCRDYAQFFNYKYKVEGRLFQGPFKAREVGTEEYLLLLTRYIHLNPIDIGVEVNNLDHYVWSSYPEYIKTRRGSLPEFFDVIRNVENYRQYVLEGVEFRNKDKLEKLAID